MQGIKPHEPWGIGSPLWATSAGTPQRHARGWCWGRLRASEGAWGGSPGPGTLCPSQMSYELWRELEEESEGDGQGRKPEIGNVFLMDRGRLERGGQWARDG